MGLGVLGGLPYLVGNACPLVSEIVTSAAKGINGFLRDEIGRLCARFMNYLPELIGIFKHGTRTKMVVVERLSLAVCGKQRIFQGLQKRMRA